MSVYQEMRDEYIAALQKECETMVANLDALSDPPFLLTEGTTGLLLAQEIESDIWDKHDDGNQGWNDEDHPYDIAMEPLIQSLVSYNQCGQEDWDKWLEFLLYHRPGDVQKIREVTEPLLVRTPQQCYHVLVDFFHNLNGRLVQHGKYPGNEMIAGEIEFRVQAIIEYWEDWAFSGDYAKIEEKVEKEMEKLRNAEPDFLTYRKYMHKKFQDTCDGRFKNYPDPDPDASDKGEIFSDEDNDKENNGNIDTDTSDSDDNASDEYSPLYGGKYIIPDDESHASSNGNRDFDRNSSDGEGGEDPASDKESDPSNSYSDQYRKLGNKNEDSGNGDQNDRSPTDNNSDDDGEDDDTVRDRWHNTICDAIDDIDKNLSRTGRFPFYVVKDSSHHTDILQSRFPLIKYRAQYEAAGEAFFKTLRDIKEKSQSDDFLAWRHFLHVKFPTMYPKPKPSLKQRREKAYTRILTEYKWFNRAIKTSGHYPQYVIGAEATLEDLARRHEVKIYNDWHKACPENEDEYPGLVEVDIAELLSKKGRHTPALQFKNWRMFLNDMFPGVQLLQSEGVSHPPTAQPSAHTATAAASSPAQSNDEDAEMSGYAETPSEKLSSARSPPPEAQNPSEQVIEGIFKGGTTKPCYDRSGPDNDDSDGDDNDDNKVVIDILATLVTTLNNSLQYEHAGRHLQYIVQDERKFAKALRKKIYSITTDTQPYEAVAKFCYESLNHAYQHRATDDFLAWRSFLHDSFPGQYPAPLLVTDVGNDSSVARTAAVSNASSDRARPEDQDQDKSNFQTTRVRIRSTLRDAIETINNKIGLDGRFPEYTIRDKQKLVELAEFLENEAFLRSGDRDDYGIQVDACYENLQSIEFHCEFDSFFDWRMFLFRNFPAEKLPMPQRIIAFPIGIPTDSSQLLPVQDEVKSNVHGNVSESQTPPIPEHTDPEPAIQSMHMKLDGEHSMDIDPPDNGRTAIVLSESAQVGVNGVGLGLIPGIQATLPASGPFALPTVSPLKSSLPSKDIEYLRDLDNIFGPDASQDRTTLFTSRSLGDPSPVKAPRKMATPRGKLVRKPAPPPHMTSGNNVSMLFNQLATQTASQPVSNILHSAPYAKLSSDIVGQGPADSSSSDNLSGFRLKPECTRFLPLSSPTRIEDPMESSPSVATQSNEARITQNVAVFAPEPSEPFVEPAAAELSEFIKSIPYKPTEKIEGPGLVTTPTLTPFLPKVPETPKGLRVSALSKTDVIAGSPAHLKSQGDSVGSFVRAFEKLNGKLCGTGNKTHRIDDRNILLHATGFDNRLWERNGGDGYKYRREVTKYLEDLTHWDWYPKSEDRLIEWKLFLEEQWPKKYPSSKQACSTAYEIVKSSATAPAPGGNPTNLSSQTLAPGSQFKLPPPIDNGGSNNNGQETESSATRAHGTTSGAVTNMPVQPIQVNVTNDYAAKKTDVVPEKVGSKALPQTPAPKPAPALLFNFNKTPALNNPSLGGAFIPFTVDRGFDAFNVSTPTAPVELEEEDKGIIRRENIRETAKKYGSPLRPQPRAPNTVRTAVTSQPPANPLALAGPVTNPFDPALFKSFPKPVVPTGSVFGKALNTPTRTPFKIVTDFNGDSFGAFNMPPSLSTKEDIIVKTENTSTIVCRPTSIRQPEAKNIAAIPISIDGPHIQSPHPAEGKKTPSVVEKPASVPEPEVQTAPSVPVSTVQPEPELPPKTRQQPEPGVQAVPVIPATKVEAEPPLSPIAQRPKLGSKSDIELSPLPSDLSDRSISEDVQIATTDHASIVPVDLEPELESDSELDLSSVPSDLSDRSVPEDVQTASVIRSPIVPPESPESPKTAPIVDQAEENILQPIEIIPKTDAKETVTVAVTTAVITPLQSDAILSALGALHGDLTSSTAGFKTEVIDLNDKLSILQADFDALKTKQYEDRLAKVESDIAGIKEQVLLNEEQNSKRYEESTAIQMATNDTVNQIFAFLKANETEKKVVSQAAITEVRPVKIEVQGPSKTEEEKAVVKIETADSKLEELKCMVGKEVGVKLVKEAAPTETVATAEVDIICTSTLQKTGLYPTLVSEAFQVPQAPVKKLSFSPVITVYVAEPTDSARNNTPAPSESTAIKDLDIPLKQPAKTVLIKQTPVENGPVKKIDKASQKAVEATVADVVLFNPDGSLNEAIPNDKLLLALSRHKYDLSPNERHIVVECARSCLSFKEFWTRVEDEGFGDLHELGYDLLETVKIYLRNILDIRTLTQHANLADRIQAFRSAYSASEAFGQCSKLGLQPLYEIHTTIKDNLHIVRLEGRDLDKCETYKRALSSFHWNIDHTIRKYWIAHKKYMDALDKLQRFENDRELARNIDLEHRTAQTNFEDRLRKLGIDPANPHMY